MEEKQFWDGPAVYGLHGLSMVSPIRTKATSYLPSVIYFTELNFESLQDTPMNDESRYVSAPGFQPTTSLILCT